MPIITKFFINQSQHFNVSMCHTCVNSDPPHFCCGETRVILLCVIDSFPCQAAAAAAACSLWPVIAMMYFKFKPVGDGCGCCLVAVLLMGKRRRGKRARRPQERAQIRKGWKMKNIMWWKQEREGGNGDLWTAALWAVERFLVSPESTVTLGLWTHIHTHCHTPANGSSHTHTKRQRSGR